MCALQHEAILGALVVVLYHRLGETQGVDDMTHEIQLKRAAERVARRFIAGTFWQGMSVRQRLEHQKANRKRPSQRTIDQLDALVPRESAFGSFAELERDMIQHGYLPTTKNRKLRQLLDSVGLPYYGVVPEVAPRDKKKAKVYVVVRRAKGALDSQRWEQEYNPLSKAERVLEFDIGVSDEALFDEFPWKMIDGRGWVKEQERWGRLDLWTDTVFLKPVYGSTKDDIEAMKGQVTDAVDKFQREHPDIEVVLRMRSGVG